MRSATPCASGWCASARGAAGGQVARLLAIGDRCAKHMNRPFTSADIDELLYDEMGLPR